MKKLYSLIRASMTSDMNLFKISTKKNSKRASLIPLFIGLYLMFMMWGAANSLFEKVAPMNMAYILLALFVFGISFMTIVEGIYKSGSLIFNCHDDQLLLSLPIKKQTVLFLRIFKFYVFELLFNSLFLLPIMIAYIRWSNVDITYYITSIIMLLLLPIIPIIISVVIGFIITSISSRFKYKNLVQIIISFVLVLGIFYISYNMDSFLEYVIAHAQSINDVITRIYYPAGVYAKLVTDFRLIDLLIFIIVNIIIFGVSILILSKFYFRINSRIKKVITTKKSENKELVIKKNSKYMSLMKKELNTFFKTPVFILNAGFALVLFMIMVIMIVINFDSTLNMISTLEGLNISKEFVMNNISVIIFILLVFCSFMTSITNAVISLEGRKINILKSLPISEKEILLSKIYAALVITTPVMVLGTIILLIKFKINIISSIVLILLSILMPLVSHLIGILVNLKYPKLDAENSSQVVKQSTSSFVAVIIGMIILMIVIGITINFIDKVEPLIVLSTALLFFIVINIILYIVLIKKGTKEFSELSI